jgi:hypothetical protein
MPPNVPELLYWSSKLEPPGEPPPGQLPHEPRPAVVVERKHCEGVVVVGPVTNSDAVAGMVTPPMLVTPEIIELKAG